MQQSVMAAEHRTRRAGVGVSWAAAAAAAALFVLLAAATPGVEGAYVYRYGQVFSWPPVRYRTQPYHLNSLTPEWDDSNSTWYVKEAGADDVPANYTIVHATTESTTPTVVSEGELVSFINTDSGRGLAWREEGEDEYFLVEQELEGASDLAVFQFQYSRSDICALLFICNWYNVRDENGSAGLAPYEEDGAIYFTKAASNLTDVAVTSLSNVEFRKWLLTLHPATMPKQSR